MPTTIRERAEVKAKRATPKLLAESCPVVSKIKALAPKAGQALASFAQTPREHGETVPYCAPMPPMPHASDLTILRHHAPPFYSTQRSRTAAPGSDWWPPQLQRQQIGTPRGAKNPFPWRPSERISRSCSWGCRSFQTEKPESFLSRSPGGAKDLERCKKRPWPLHCCVMLKAGWKNLCEFQSLHNIFFGNYCKMSGCVRFGAPKFTWFLTATCKMGTEGQSQETHLQGKGDAASDPTGSS